MSGATTGGVKNILKLESFCVFLITLLSYTKHGLGWKIFAIFFFTPDVAFFGYLAGATFGACIYNTTHSYIGPIIAVLLGIFFASHIAVVIGIIWCSHIAFNRLLGYGLKYSSRMGRTHLGLIGSRQETVEKNPLNDAATGGVRTLLRIEGFCFLLVALFAYFKLGLGWKIFALFFFVPDIAFVGYLAGATFGACAYNTTHSFVGATLLLLFGMLSHTHLAVVAGIIWSAHIGFDRALGYGLKYRSGFGFTHLGLIGKMKREAV